MPCRNINQRRFYSRHYQRERTWFSGRPLDCTAEKSDLDSLFDLPDGVGEDPPLDDGPLERDREREKAEEEERQKKEAERLKAAPPLKSPAVATKSTPAPAQSVPKGNAQDLERLGMGFKRLGFGSVPQPAASSSNAR